MRRILISLAFIAAPATAQTTVPAPPPPAAAAPAPAVWDPAAPYITNGQDEPGYRSWYLAAAVAVRAGQVVQRLSDHLSGLGNRSDVAAAAHGDGVEGLRRTAVRGSAHHRVAAHRPDLALRPRLRDPRSGTGRAGLRLSQSGAQPMRGRSARERAQASIRRSTWSRCGRCTARSADADLVHRPCGARGRPTARGSASYAYLRFHVDSTKFRRWNMDPAVAAAMPADHPSRGHRDGWPAGNDRAPGTATVPPGTVSRTDCGGTIRAGLTPSQHARNSIERRTPLCCPCATPYRRQKRGRTIWILKSSPTARAGFFRPRRRSRFASIISGSRRRIC